MVKKTKTKPKGTGKARPDCHLVTCIDPVTGKVVIRPQGNCPPGYIEEVKKKIQADGIYFPRKLVKDLDE